MLITNCTARKRLRAPANLQINSVPRGPMLEMAQEWAQRVRLAPCLLPARRMYMGRGILESGRAAALADGDLYVLSAGLGLVKANEAIPSYEATISGTSDNNLIRRSRSGRDSSPEWWQHLTQSLGTPQPLRLLVENSPPDTIVIAAISRPYLFMVAAELAALSARDLQRMRILSHGSPRGLPSILESVVISYGEQFDGPDSPLPGTKADFLQRAAVHFVGNVINAGGSGTSDDHRFQVQASLSNMALPAISTRKRMSDSELIKVIRDHLLAVNGKSSRMLRHLRDNLGISCEQGRFRNLFKVATARAADEESTDG